MLIATLLFSSCTNIIIGSLAQKLMVHQPSIRNYQTSWQIIRLLEQDAQQLLKSEPLLNSTDKIIGQSYQEDQTYTASIERHILYYQYNNNYKLYIQIERNYARDTAQSSAKITAWHFGA